MNIFVFWLYFEFKWKSIFIFSIDGHGQTNAKSWPLIFPIFQFISYPMYSFRLLVIHYFFFNNVCNLNNF